MRKLIISLLLISTPIYMFALRASSTAHAATPNQLFYNNGNSYVPITNQTPAPYVPITNQTPAPKSATDFVQREIYFGPSGHDPEEVSAKFGYDNLVASVLAEAFNGTRPNKNSQAYRDAFDIVQGSPSGEFDIVPGETERHPSSLLPVPKTFQQFSQELALVDQRYEPKDRRFFSKKQANEQNKLREQFKIEKDKLNEREDLNKKISEGLSVVDQRHEPRSRRVVGRDERKQRDEMEKQFEIENDEFNEREGLNKQFKDRLFSQK